ncbi:MAG: ATP-dependent helicase, partial [Candidatus Cloacimonetes bacterium]|nr:ATP-dependent helicase [Candidatus Cloacimonadota bacterium]
LPMGYTQTFISTFHSFCEQVLRNEAVHIGLCPDFRIMSEAETYLFIKNHLFDFKLKYFRPLGNPTKFISGLATHFSRLKDEDVSPEEYQNYARKLASRRLASRRETNILNAQELEKLQELANAHQVYEKLKVQEGAMDFADLIGNTLKLFRARGNILRKYQQQFKYILVDEFQDTNLAQNELAMLLSSDDQNITVVADDDQSIYRWRGAAVYNVIDFRSHFPEAKIITLIKNYRSPQVLLDRAYQLIQHNNPDRLEVKEKVDKHLRSQGSGVRGRGSVIKLIWEERVEDEAEKVAREIEQLVAPPSAGGKNVEKQLPQVPTERRNATTSEPAESAGERNNTYHFKDTAILVRANSHADAFVQALSRRGIPYQFLGPGRLFYQPEIKDLIAYLKVLNNFTDNVPMYRVLNIPYLGFNPRDIAWLVIQARKNNLSLFESLEKLIGELEIRELEKKANSLIHQFANSLSEETLRKAKKLVGMVHRHLGLVPENTPGQILYFFLKDTGLLKKYSSPQSPLEERAVQNVARFFDKLKAFETQNPEARVADFVSYLDFIIAAGESPLAGEIDWAAEDAVNILTVHSAKGLEFPVVFLVNLVSDRFPTRARSEQIPVPEDLIKESLPKGDPHEQEERRLFYVGMTRAKEKLYFSGAKFYGEGKRPKRLSPFVYEALGEDLEPFMLRKKENLTPTLFGWQSERTKELETSELAKAANQRENQQARKPVNFLSYSQINTFEICPLQYKFKYILRIPVPQSAAASFGNAMHTALRDFYKSLKAGKKLALGELQKLLDKHWSPEGYESKEHEKKRRQEGKAALAEYFNKHHDEKNLPIRLESPFKIRLNSLWIGGYIDRIDEIAEGLEVIDYKTGKVAKDSEVAKDLQLTIYAMAVAQPAVFGEPLDKQKLSFYFFETAEKKTTQRTQKEIE